MSWLYAVFVSFFFWAYTSSGVDDHRSMVHALVVFVVTYFLGRISSDAEDLLKEVKKLNQK